MLRPLTYFGSCCLFAHLDLRGFFFLFLSLLIFFFLLERGWREGEGESGGQSRGPTSCWAQGSGSGRRRAWLRPPGLAALGDGPWSPALASRPGLLPLPSPSPAHSLPREQLQRDLRRPGDSRPPPSLPRLPAHTALLGLFVFFFFFQSFFSSLSLFLLLFFFPPFFSISESLHSPSSGGATCSPPAAARARSLPQPPRADNALGPGSAAPRPRDRGAGSPKRAAEGSEPAPPGGGGGGSWARAAGSINRKVLPFSPGRILLKAGLGGRHLPAIFFSSLTFCLAPPSRGGGRGEGGGVRVRGLAGESAGVRGARGPRRAAAVAVAVAATVAAAALLSLGGYGKVVGPERRRRPDVPSRPECSQPQLAASSAARAWSSLCSPAASVHAPHSARGPGRPGSRDMPGAETGGRRGPPCTLR